MKNHTHHIYVGRRIENRLFTLYTDCGAGSYYVSWWCDDIMLMVDDVCACLFDCCLFRQQFFFFLFSSFDRSFVFQRFHLNVTCFIRTHSETLLNRFFLLQNYTYFLLSIFFNTKNGKNKKLIFFHSTVGYLHSFRLFSASLFFLKKKFMWTYEK